MSLLTILLSLGIGLVSGVVAALCGVGGGVVMVPAFVYFLAMGQKQAVATSLLVIIPTAIVASMQNQKNGFGDWKIAVAVALGACLSAWFAADWLKTLSSVTLTRIFGAVLLVMGARMLIFARA